MNREALLELAFERSTLDADVIDSLTDDQLRELCGFRDREDESPDVPKKRKRRPIKPRAIVPKIEDMDYIERDGTLFKRLEYSNGQVMHVKCGNRVQFDKQTVSASIVLHWLRTGERVARVPVEVKVYRAVVREGNKVKHLGRFATREERDAVIVNYRLGFAPSK